MDVIDSRRIFSFGMTLKEIYICINKTERYYFFLHYTSANDEEKKL